MVLKTLVVGHGYMGRIHLSTLQLLRQQRKVGALSVIDTDPSRLPGIDDSVKTYISLEKALVEEKPELIVVASNTAKHAENIQDIVRFAEQQDHFPSLFVEKPFVGSMDEATTLIPQLQAAGYGSTNPLAFAYLMRFSGAVDAARCYLGGVSSRIMNIDILWQKKRLPTRPSAGIHIDETTHGIDLAFYLLENDRDKIKKAALFEKECDYSLAIVEEEAQRCLYGEKHLPMARVRYRFTVDDFVSLSGLSSFLDDPQRREMTIYIAGGQEIRLLFDVNKKDFFSVWYPRLGNCRIIPEQEFPLDTAETNRSYQELAAMIEYHQAGKRPEKLVGLDDAVRDLALTELLGREDLVLPYRFTI